MSAQLTSFTQKRGTKFLLFTSLVTILFAFAPSSVSADTLPFGVLERQTCGTYTVDIQGYGAGMMHNSNPIEITERRVSYISATDSCAVIQWESSTPAATQVLFTELTTEPVTISTDIDPKFGYPNASTQNNAGNSQHTAILTGLEAGKAYSYRLVTRSHPSALPTISDPHVLIAGPSVYIAPPTTTDAIKIPAPTTEKLPTVPKVAAVSEKPSKTITPEEGSDETVVPAAITAVNEALGAKSKEGTLFKSLKEFLLGIKPDMSRFSLSSSIGLFEKDRYIMPTLLFFGILFLLQHFVLPAFSVSLKNPLLYWLVGSVVLAVLSSVFMLYYVTLLAIALFLGILAWYLLQNISEDMDVPTQQKLLETTASSHTKTEKEKGTD